MLAIATEYVAKQTDGGNILRRFAAKMSYSILHFIQTYASLERTAKNSRRFLSIKEMTMQALVAKRYGRTADRRISGLH